MEGEYASYIHKILVNVYAKYIHDSAVVSGWISAVHSNLTEKVETNPYDRTTSGRSAAVDICNYQKIESQLKNSSSKPC